MTSAQWQRVRDLFERALDQQPADIVAWLEAEAVDDDKVRAEVASLLQQQSKVGDFMAQPVVGRLPHLLADEESLRPGQVVGPYTITREAGRGGMGRVYLATDTRLGRRVALKALSPELGGDSHERERLKREARAAASLAHSGICTVYALEEIEGQLFIASEFIDGRTLRDEIKNGLRPSARQALDTARQLASALASAHVKGIVHRDLKPENVMRTREGQLKILDFGLARMEHGAAEMIATRVTVPGAIVGTPAYMAPEQLNGKQADARSDVFAYGVMMYEYIAGSHPFCATSSLALAARVLESDAAPLGRLAGEVPPRLVEVIERCLQKDPNRRLQSAVEIELALENGDVAAPQPVPAAGWWRTHHLSILALYGLVAFVAWLAKEWQPGWPNRVFVLVSVLATIGGVLRAHLLFIERVHASGLGPARQRAEPVTWLVDLGIGVALLADGVMLLPTREVAGVLVSALGVGLALARIVIEPSTATAAFARGLVSTKSE